MAITTQFLSQCTEAQINKGVAWAKIKSLPLTDKSGGRYELYRLFSNALIDDLSDYGFDPCEYPNDIMPIAFANGIGVEPPESGANYNEWEAGSGLFIRENGVQNYKVYSEHLNPLRAICEVYILMSVSK